MLGAELTRIENSVTAARLELAKIDRDIEDLHKADPEKRKEELRRLLEHLGDAEDQVETRRALAGELNRVLRKVTISINERVAWEIADDNPDWMAKYGVKSLAQLERLCKEHSFDLHLVYRSGDTVSVDALDGEFFRAKKSLRMKSLEYRAK
ncbi:hypothetical protein [Lysobacter changpingensis]|uniref:hypothetical protein n=1 Tax=Lysobacter changpingensis TaxID=2792784 RepID=UPI001A8C86C1|nr:hypothetical protein [Lysobacter changpingensis]